MGVAFDITLIVTTATLAATGALMTVAALLARRTQESTSLKRRPAKSAPTPDDERVQKKVDLLRRKDPKVFYYLDKELVDDLHAQIEQRQLTRIERTKATQGEKTIEAKSPVLGGSYGRGSKEETKEVFEIRQQRATMYNQVEDHLIEKRKLNFGVEDFAYDKSKIDDFDVLRAQIKEKCEFEIPDSVRENFVTKTMGEFAKVKVGQLAVCVGYIAIDSEFSVALLDSEICTLEISHPLNEYLPVGESPVKIVVNCSKANMTSLGLNTFQQGRIVKAICVGNVASWNDEGRTLEINPIVMY